MTHPRTAIRHAARAALENATIAQDRVWVNRPNPLSQRPGTRSTSSQLPAILIYTKDEQIQEHTAAPRELLRTTELVVELAHAMTDTIDDELDAFASTVEHLLLDEDSLGGACSELRLTASSMTIVDAGDIPIGAVILTFEADYYEAFPAPEQPAGLDDFNTLATRTSLGGDQATADQTGDTISLRE